jgi:hypothetical protein
MGREHIAEYRKREPRDRRATGKPQDASGFRAKCLGRGGKVTFRPRPGTSSSLRSNPAPDLQELLGKHGRYDKIPAEAWAEHDRTMAEWQERRRNRLAGAPFSEIRIGPRRIPRRTASAA